MSNTLIVCLTPAEAEVTDGRTFVLWDRERDGGQFYAYIPGPGYYESPFPELTIFEGVERVAFSQSVVREAFDFTSPYGADIRARFRWFVNLGRWD